MIEIAVTVTEEQHGRNSAGTKGKDLPTVGEGIEPSSRDSRPRVLPMHQPTFYFSSLFNFQGTNVRLFRRKPLEFILEAFDKRFVMRAKLYGHRVPHQREDTENTLAVYDISTIPDIYL